MGPARAAANDSDSESVEPASKKQKTDEPLAPEEVADSGKGKAKGKDGKDKGKDGKGKGKKWEQNQDQTAFVRGLSFESEEATLRKDFAECGEIVNLRMPLNEE